MALNRGMDFGRKEVFPTSDLPAMYTPGPVHVNDLKAPVVGGQKACVKSFSACSNYSDCDKGTRNADSLDTLLDNIFGNKIFRCWSSHFFLLANKPLVGQGSYSCYIHVCCPCCCT